MKYKRVPFSYYLIAFMVLSLGCQKGPLFNHRKAQRLDNSELKPTSNCPIQFPTLKICAQWTWIQLQSGDETGIAELAIWKLENDNSPLILLETPQVKLWMPSMGHGSTPVQIQEKPGSGDSQIRYLISEVWFVMPGAWEIQISLKGQKDAQETIAFELQVQP